MTDWLAGDFDIGVGLISARLDSLVHRIDRLAAAQNTFPADHHDSQVTRVYWRRKTFSAMEPRQYRDQNVYVILNHQDISMAPYSSVYFATELDFEAEHNIAATIIGHPIRFTEPPAVIPSHFVRQTPGRGLSLELYNYSSNNVIVRRGSPMALVYFSKIENVVMLSRPQRHMAESPRFPPTNGNGFITSQAPWIRPDNILDPPPAYRRHPREEEIEAMFFVGSSSSSTSPDEDEYDPGPPDPESPSYRPGTPDYQWTSDSTTEEAGATTPEMEVRTRLTRSPSYSSLSSEASRLTPLGIRRALETDGYDSTVETGESINSVGTDTTTVPLDEEDTSINFSAVMLQEDLAYGSVDPAHHPRDDLPELERPMDLPNGMDSTSWTLRWVRNSMDLLNWVYIPDPVEVPIEVAEDHKDLLGA
jgi:hypothetical protein